jgi:hypothetical protein
MALSEAMHQPLFKAAQEHLKSVPATEQSVHARTHTHSPPRTAFASFPSLLYRPRLFLGQAGMVLDQFGCAIAFGRFPGLRVGRCVGWQRK